MSRLERYSRERISSEQVVAGDAVDGFGPRAISPREFGEILGLTNYWSARLFLRRIREALPPARKRRVLKDAIRRLFNTPPSLGRSPCSRKLEMICPSGKPFCAISM